jgi:hypothetical protein
MNIISRFELSYNGMYLTLDKAGFNIGDPAIALAQQHYANEPRTWSLAPIS